MADYYSFDPLKGIVQTDTSTILDEVNQEIKDAFGNDIDLSPETPQGRFAELITTERASVIGFNAAVSNQINLDYATGIYLDALGSLFRVSRIGATSSRVFATLSGVAGTIIPAGSIAKSGENEFYLENQVTLPVAGAYFLSVNTGAVPCDPGTLNKIVTSVLGWTGITNSSEPAPYGTDQESDAAYRQRIKESRYSGRGFVNDIGTAIKAVPNVLSSFVYDNGTGSPVIYDTITIDAHSIIAIVDGGDDDELAQAIFSKKSGGCGYTKINGEAVITFSDVGNDGEIVTVAGIDYRLKTTMSQAYDVQIGASADDTATSLKSAINLDGTEGVDYFAGTAANPLATAAMTDTAEITVTGGQYGQTLASTDSIEASVVINSVSQQVTKIVTDGVYFTPYQVIFNRPLDIAIDVEITVKAGDASESEATAAIKAAIADWAAGEIEGIDGLTIGQDVSPFEIAAAVSDSIPFLYVKKCQIAYHGDPLATDELDINISQIARIDPDDITVVFA